MLLSEPVVLHDRLPISGVARRLLPRLLNGRLGRLESRRLFGESPRRLADVRALPPELRFKQLQALDRTLRARRRHRRLLLRLAHRRRRVRELV